MNKTDEGNQQLLMLRRRIRERDCSLEQALQNSCAS